MGECDRSGSEPHTESGVISPKSRREDDGDSDEDGERVLGDASISQEDFFECSADLEAWIGIEEGVVAQRVACSV